MIGDVLGPYRIESELGSGGMGKVYAAVVDARVPGLTEGTRVAVKVVHPHLLEVPGFFKRFLREAELGKTVRHPNVVRTYDCDATGEQHFIAMEYVEGQTLRELLEELERVPEELCRHIGQEVAKGLSAIHDAGVIHRDMKPDNVLITADHVVKVMDLGVARLADEAIRLSQTGAFVGSLCYAAPESFQKGGADVDGRVDLHALGLVLYELACGTNPYVADGITATIQRVVREQLRRLGDANPQLSPFFEEAVHCLLEKDREKRFASAHDLAAVLSEGEDSPWWRARSQSLRAATSRPLRRIRIPRETAVYGREDELATLRDLYDRATSSDGQVLLIEGEAGIGKSRIVDELIGRLQRDGEVINFLFGSYPPGGAATASGAFSTAYREHVGESGSAPYLTQTPILVPAFDALLKGESAPTGVELLTKSSPQTCFVNVTRSLAAERTTVVLIDDLHFAPDEGRSLFTSLAMAVPGERVLLIGTTRRGASDTWMSGLTRLDQTSHLQLARLGPKELVGLLEDAFRSKALAEVLGLQIVLKSDGNPFFAFEIIRGLREGQFITQAADGTWVSTQVIEDIQIPSTVLDLVSARVAGLSDDERALLDIAACWGYEFDPLLVGEVLGLARIPLLRQLGQIERRHRLVRASGREYVFDHHQVQEALYASLSELLREEYHAALAETLETRTKAREAAPESLNGALCVDLCEHYLKGARGESALRYLQAAQDHLTNGYLHAEAADLAERALGVPGLLAGTDRAKVLLRRASVLAPKGTASHKEDCAEEAERLAEAAGDARLQGTAAVDLGNVLWRSSRHDDAEAAYRRALEVSRETGDKHIEARATGGLGTILRHRGRVDDALVHHERCRALHSANGNRSEEAVALGSLGSAYATMGRVDLAREHHERARALHREIGNRHGETVATGNIGNALEAEGRLDEAREHFERTVAMTREIGFRHGEAVTLGNLGGLYRALGRLSEAVSYHERSLAMSREVGGRRTEAIALVNLGELWLVLGDRTRARETLERSGAISREAGSPYSEAYAIQHLGSLADQEGDTVRAVQLMQESLAVRRRAGHGDGIADSLTQIADLRWRAGDIEGARAALEESLAVSRGRRAGAVLAQAMLACLPGGDVNAAVAVGAAAGQSKHSLRTQWLLWRATGGPVYLVEARRLLDEQLSYAPSRHHEAMLANVPLHRDIVAASEAHGS